MINLIKIQFKAMQTAFGLLPTKVKIGIGVIVILIIILLLYKPKK